MEEDQTETSLKGQVLRPPIFSAIWLALTLATGKSWLVVLVGFVLAYAFDQVSVHFRPFYVEIENGEEEAEESLKKRKADTRLVS